MAPDLKTFVALQTSSTTLGTDSPYISRDDESEARMLQDLNGVGSAIYMTDDDVKGYALQDYGLNLRNDDGL
jgi:hypothetical protein